MAKNNILTTGEIDSFIARLRATVAAAVGNQSLITALSRLVRGEGAPSAPRATTTRATGTRRGGRRGRGRGGRRGRGAPDGLEDKVLGLVRNAGAGGIQMGALEDGTRQPAKTIRKALEKLRQSGSVRVVGQRRATRYHAAA